MGGTSSKPKHVPATPPSKTLQLGGRQLTEIDPTDLNVEIEGLEELWLQDNEFDTLPEELGGATQTILFYVTNNRLSEIPSWTSNWTVLEELNLRWVKCNLPRSLKLTSSWGQQKPNSRNS